MPAARTRAAKGKPKSGTAKRRARFAPPQTVSHPDLLISGTDDAFRETIYVMALALSRLQSCREAFGRATSLTGPQFAVLIGTSYQQKDEGVPIRALADYVQLAPTHVTTEVGRLIRKGLLIKRANQHDRRSVLVSLSPKGEAVILGVAPFLRRVNDLLFADVSRQDFQAVRKFFNLFVLNSEYALAEIRRYEREGAKGLANPFAPERSRSE